MSTRMRNATIAVRRFRRIALLLHEADLVSPFVFDALDVHRLSQAVRQARENAKFRAENAKFGARQRKRRR